MELELCPSYILLLFAQELQAKGFRAVAPDLLSECPEPSPKPYRDGLVALCASAQAVFYKQPTRLFLHASYICGSLVEFWYYETMTNQELGMSNIFSIDDQGQYIMLDDNNGMADSRAIKIKWPSANARPENELLDMAMNKNAWGATKLDLYHAGLLHGDISPGNMIIADTPGAGQPRGILIDLEFAMPRDPAPERDPNVTIGTRPFMSIGYMNGEAKTYRQHLEAFFYVLLHMLVGGRDMELPAESRMRAWAHGGGGVAGSDAWRELAKRKLRDMEEQSFRHIVNEILPEFTSVKGLVERLRALLFPVRDGKIWVGTDHTPEEVEALYDGVISAFDDVVAAET
ncbi:hypothetical protein MY10362_005299 [Beauveria mimosiformis]